MITFSSFTLGKTENFVNNDSLLKPQTGVPLKRSANLQITGFSFTVAGY
jgi:hypothetical protein